MPIPLPGPVILFIGTCEVLGALGLILPGLTGVRPHLTPMAAVALVLLTACAAIYQLFAGQPESAVFALGVGMLAAAVAYGRWRLVPHRPRRAVPTRPWLPVGAREEGGDHRVAGAGAAILARSA